MAQASALAIGSARAFQHGSAPLVQRPLRPLYRERTSFSSGDLADSTIISLLENSARRGGVYRNRISRQSFKNLSLR